MIYEMVPDVIWKTNNFESSVGLLILKKYVNGTIIQWDRIQIDKKMLPGPGPGVDHRLMDTLFLDIHFYFVCFDKCQNLIEYLAKTDGDPKLDVLWQELKPKFKPFNDARNHLEHIETRLTKDYFSDLGNMLNDTYTFGGDSYNVSASGLKILTDAYEQILTIIGSRPSKSTG